MDDVLRGKFFGVYGFLSAERKRIARKITGLSGRVVLDTRLRVVDPAAAATKAVVYVITNDWVSFVPIHTTRFKFFMRIQPKALEMVHVTEFWLDQVIETKQFPKLERCKFFTPPTGNATLKYPVHCAVEDTASESQDPRVLLPCSPRNLKDQRVPLWPFLASFLGQPMPNVNQLGAVLKRIVGFRRASALDGLIRTLQQLFTDQERSRFFDETLPIMVQAALNVAFYFPDSLPLLVSLNDSTASDVCEWTDLNDRSTRPRFVTRSCHLTRPQVFCLLSHCFFCTFPSQSTQVGNQQQREKKEPRRAFPCFNMLQLFQDRWGVPLKFEASKLHRLRAILQYFVRVAPSLRKSSVEDTFVISYTRVALRFRDPRSSEQLHQVDDSSKRRRSQEQLGDSVPLVVDGKTAVDLMEKSLNQCEQQEGCLHRCLKRVELMTTKLIEDMEGHIQVDFANAYAGGGVLSHGCAQEEIRFCISPELVVSCAIFERLQPNEVFLIVGSERFAKYSGYGFSFQYQGNYVDSTPWAPCDSVCTSLSRSTPLVQYRSAVVGMDAMDYRKCDEAEQFSNMHVWREFVKSFTGFFLPRPTATVDWPIATGNWGGGVFCGDMELKFLIQWAAACLQGRSLSYVVVDAQEQVVQRFVDRVSRLNGLCVDDDGLSSKRLRKLLEFLFELEQTSSTPISQSKSVLESAFQFLTQDSTAGRQRQQENTEVQLVDVSTRNLAFSKQFN